MGRSGISLQNGSVAPPISLGSFSYAGKRGGAGFAALKQKGLGITAPSAQGGGQSAVLDQRKSGLVPVVDAGKSNRVFVEHPIQAGASLSQPAKTP